MKKVPILLDSGAFTAWTQGVKLDIDQYIDFIKRNEEYIENYVVLDVIPGDNRSFGTPAQIEASAALSYENLQYMKRHGLSPIPVFHQGERMYWLDKLLDDGEPYIGISPKTYRAGVETYRPWLDNVWTRLVDKRGWPKVKTHGFGVTSFELMVRYPWTSVDSTTWSKIASMGGIFVPIYFDGEADYTRPPIQVFFTKDSKKADHYQRLGNSVRSWIREYLKRIDMTVEQVTEDFRARYRVNILYFEAFSKSIEPRPFHYLRREG